MGKGGEGKRWIGFRVRLDHDWRVSSEEFVKTRKDGEKRRKVAKVLRLLSFHRFFYKSPNSTCGTLHLSLSLSKGCTVRPLSNSYTGTASSGPFVAARRGVRL